MITRRLLIQSSAAAIGFLATRLRAAHAENARGVTDTDATWSQGLSLGVNGPIPFIVVDQFGYPTKASKIAVIRDPQVGYDSAAHFTPGATYALVDRSTGKIAKQGPPAPWNGGATIACQATRSGGLISLRSQLPEPTQSSMSTRIAIPEFQIDDQVYRNVLKHATRMYFYQRAGFKKTAETVGSDWADAASHMGPGQDPQTRPWPARRALSLAKLRRSKIFTEAGSTLATTTSIRVGRLATLLSCFVLMVKTPLRSATTLA